jgi:DNA-nicking Smr family endonuclease
MPKRPSKQEEEIAAFHQAMKDAKPLPHQKIRIATPPKKQPRVRSPEIEPERVRITELLALHTVSGEEFISYKQEGVSNKTLRKLRKGQYNVEAILDLHGMSVEKAIMAIEGFLQQALSDGIRLVLIIHGKGLHSQEPILKNKLNHWLRDMTSVLAFCSAAPKHGSRGAIYVLLKRTTEENSA